MDFWVHTQTILPQQAIIGEYCNDRDDGANAQNQAIAGLTNLHSILTDNLNRRNFESDQD